MNPEELKTRTKKFALCVLNLANQFPRGLKGRILSDQLARSGASAGIWQFILTRSEECSPALFSFCVPQIAFDPRSRANVKARGRCTA